MSPSGRSIALCLGGLAFLAAGCATPLQRAAIAGDASRVGALLSASPRPKSKELGKALIYAAREGQDPVVVALLDAGVDVNFPDYDTGWTPLTIAAAHSHESTARLLLARGAPAEESITFLHQYSGVTGAIGGANLLKRLIGHGSPRPQNSQATPQTASASAPGAGQRRAPASDVEVPSYSMPERKQDLAVVVGIEDYSDLLKAPYAERDAAAFAAHARALGVPARNVVLLTGAKAGRAAIEKYVEQWLPRLAASDSIVYFYFSGHGAPDVKNGQAYLVPWDGDPNFLETTGYSVKRLYERLRGLNAKQVIVAMDTCFSGAGGRSVLASGARPLVTRVDAGGVGAGVTALTASAANEISGSLDDRGHGAFTYFLLEGLNGGSKDLSAAGLVRYLTPLVQDEARRLNRDQTPQLLGDGSVRFR